MIGAGQGQVVLLDDLGQVDGAPQSTLSRHRYSSYGGAGQLVALEATAAAQMCPGIQLTSS